MKKIYCLRNLIITTPKIKLRTKICPPKFLDTEFIILHNEVITYAHRNESNLFVPWESKVSMHYKRNIILGELHRANKIASNFQKDVENIKEKFSKTNFSLTFMNIVVAQFNNNTYNNNETNKEDEMMIQPQLSEIPNKILFLQVPFFEANEKR